MLSTWVIFPDFTLRIKSTSFDRWIYQTITMSQLKLSKDYEWSSREITTCGSPLIDLIDLGISRLKYACDIIYALTDELKLASTANKCQTLVAIDGFNAFFADNSIVKNENRKIVKPMQISLTSAFLNMTNYDWCNGAIVVTVDPMASLVSWHFF